MSTKPSRKTFRARLDEMVNKLRADIETGKYAPGSFLPSEEVLAEQFDVSNKSAAKGLDILAAEGLVVKIRRVGSKVVKKEIVHFGFHAAMYRDVELRMLLDAFHRVHPHIEIKPISISENYSSGTMDELLTSGRFDVMMMNQIYYRNALDNRQLEALEPLGLPEDAYPFIRNALTANGKGYVRPLVFSPVVLCYNKEHFEQAGLPEPDSGWSWQQLLDAASLLSKGQDRYGFCCNLLSSNNRWPVLLLQKAADTAPNDAGIRQLNVSEVQDALSFCRDILDAEGVVPGFVSAQSSQTLFLEGKISMLMTTYFLLNDFKHAPIRYDVAPLPYFAEPRTMILWIGLAVYRKSNVLEAARAFVDFMSSREAQEIVRRNTLSIPASTAVAGMPHDASLNAPSRYNLYRETIPSYRMITEYDISYDALEEMRQLLMLYHSGIVKPEELKERLRLLLPQR